jgi:uncharacterized membrane protein (UPF0127 family)
MPLSKFAAACGLLFAVIATGAGAKLPHAVLIIDSAQGPKRFTVEIAADEPSRMQGLMFRKSLAPDSGMLFEFPDDHFRSFWMKNTILSLDMLFIRADGTISSIAANTTPYSEAEILSKEPVRAVLEINGGRSAALGIVPGARVHHAVFGDALPGQ